MLQGNYTYNRRKQELKPIDNTSPIYSIRTGELNPNTIFINRVGDKQTWQGIAKRKILVDAIYYGFEYNGTHYTFTIPDKLKRSETIAVLATA
ncbi:hypothetical protein KBK19_15535 [Microvirga sp. STR05]|uniref:Uncharacterized protein n=1 Tax=Hymenobacter duratus TaxID=2771356 RepID=A0ABR8JHW9_9BACT|nr:hypothetical protein [Hymenobacter duratus]MBD2716453.1 hypothetical protein [Hymenobacter duratus]MBR7951368.1 hypothetical protein [Microvirga sp. STR05]